MDYKAFFADVEAWVGQVNQAAMRYGMENSEFWLWVAESCGQLCQKYHENRLVIKQMMMLVEWLEDVKESRKAS